MEKMQSRAVNDMTTMENMANKNQSKSKGSFLPRLASRLRLSAPKDKKQPLRDNNDKEKDLNDPDFWSGTGGITGGTIVYKKLMQVSPREEILPKGSYEKDRLVASADFSEPDGTVLLSAKEIQEEKILKDLDTTKETYATYDSKYSRKLDNINDLIDSVNTLYREKHPPNRFERRNIIVHNPNKPINRTEGGRNKIERIRASEIKEDDAVIIRPIGSVFVIRSDPPSNDRESDQKAPKTRGKSSAKRGKDHVNKEKMNALDLQLFVESMDTIVRIKQSRAQKRAEIRRQYHEKRMESIRELFSKLGPITPPRNSAPPTDTIYENFFPNYDYPRKICVQAIVDRYSDSSPLSSVSSFEKSDTDDDYFSISFDNSNYCSQKDSRTIQEQRSRQQKQQQEQQQQQQLQQQQRSHHSNKSAAFDVTRAEFNSAFDSALDGFLLDADRVIPGSNDITPPYCTRLKKPAAKAPTFRQRKRSHLFSSTPKLRSPSTSISKSVQLLSCRTLDESESHHAKQQHDTFNTPKSSHSMLKKHDSTSILDQSDNGVTFFSRARRYLPL